MMAGMARPSMPMMSGMKAVPIIFLVSLVPAEFSPDMTFWRMIQEGEGGRGLPAPAPHWHRAEHVMRRGFGCCTFPEAAPAQKPRVL
jgi:hypothetical protein